MDFELARRNMIDSQIRTWEVLDQTVLDTIAQVPREAFVPADFRSLAFSDCNIPLGEGEVMMAPRVEARMLQALAIQAHERVLEIGTGSGYVTACLARLSARVRSIDINPAFVAGAAARLRAHRIDNAELAVGDGARGVFDGAPWDVVAYTGALAIFDPHFADMLAPGGRMFLVVGMPPVMEARLITRTAAGAWTSEVLFETVLPLLRGAPRPDTFKF